MIDVGMIMRKLLKKAALGTASVLALCVAGAAFDYAADAGNAANAESLASPIQSLDYSQSSASLRKDDVRWAQVELRQRGYYRGSLDGVLGPETKHALLRFQKQSGLPKTASLDAQTWEALTGSPEATEGSSLPPGATGPAASSFGNSAAGK